MAASSVTPQGTSRTAAKDRSLGLALGSSDNALNFLRLVFALLVIVSHTPAISGAVWPAWTASLGGWSVSGFFIISGYLITGSRMRSSWWSYVVRRAARIYPAYWVQLLIVAFILAPIATLLGPSTWSPASAAEYVARNVTTFALQFSMEGMVFPHYDAWNGSAWTLMYEILAYAGCLVLFSIPWCRRHATLMAAMALIGFTSVTALAGPLDITTNLYLNIAHLGSFFAAGMLIFTLREKLPITGPLILGSAVLTAVLFVVPEGYRYAAVPYGYLVLAAGATIRTRVGATNDVSYGVYIYAFPVQQLWAMLGLTGLAHLLASTVVTVILAWASWKVVEAPMNAAGRRLISVVRGEGPRAFSRPPRSKP
ncbi:acyltransferase family protein [Brachybacterium hainanense]|uniref:Acyltransferase family protein n=1 Tax=Brachybacterium hainanense TaxID=1541174 RepID=A0ABV6RCI0_9MICO